MEKVYCWAVYWKNQEESFWRSRMTYQKLADRTYTKEDAIRILIEVTSQSITIESKFETIMEGSEKHRLILLDAERGTSN